jgi:hypothetical protein
LLAQLVNDAPVASWNDRGMTTPITIPELAEWMQRHILLTFDLFERYCDEGNEGEQRWCRGRIDAWFQIMEIINKDRLDMLRSNWQDVVRRHSPVDDDGLED